MTLPIKELRAKAEAATSGPWTASEAPSNTGHVGVYCATGFPVASCTVVWNRAKSAELADAAFIAAASPDVVLALLDRIATLTALVGEACNLASEGYSRGWDGLDSSDANKRIAAIRAKAGV